jgi:8-oxo-dGTP pyrophosphatase MutT (NUDIX family)
MVTTDPIKPKQVRAITERVDAALDPVVEVVRAHAPGTTITVGGTVRALARVAAERAGVWLPATLNQLRVPTRELAELRDELLALDLAGRTDVPAMKDRRADHVHVAAIVLTRALERLGVATATISDWGLREGLLLDAHGVSAPPSASQLRHQEVERLRRTFAPDDPHLPHVAHLAIQLFDGTLELHGLSATDRELLGHAARLHGIGEALALRRQQEHGAYLVRNGELRGFDPAEVAVLTTLVRFHPSRGIDPREPAFASLTDVQADRARRLLGLLQLADALDRAHDQAVERVDVQHRRTVGARAARRRPARHPRRAGAPHPLVHAGLRRRGGGQRPRGRVSTPRPGRAARPVRPARDPGRRRPAGVGPVADRRGRRRPEGHRPRRPPAGLRRRRDAAGRPGRSAARAGPRAVVASRVVPPHPRLPAEPQVGTREQPLVREAARVLLLDPRDRVLLVAHVPSAGRRVWTAPGGGLRPGEDHVSAARRELVEELDVDVTPGPWVWTRREVFAFRGVWLDQAERWYLARVAGLDPEQVPLDDPATDAARWWSVEELATTQDVLAPATFAEELTRLLVEGPPARPRTVGR